MSSEIQARKQRVREKLNEQFKSSEKVVTEQKNLAGTGARIGSGPDPPELLEPDQCWLVYSAVGPSGRQKARTCYAKFRGVFATEELARAKARKIIDIDPDFDVWVFDARHWFPVPPPEDAIDHVRMEYANQPELDNAMKHHYDAIERARQNVEKRKAEGMEEARKKAAAARAKREHEQGGK